MAPEFCLALKYCTLHIIQNVVRAFPKFNSQNNNLVWGLQSAETEDAYRSKLAWIELELGVKVKIYLERIAPIQ